MRKHNTSGFTIIELMIVIAIVAILAAIALPAIFGGTDTRSGSYGFNGYVETRCVAGYLYTIDQAGTARQILDADGRATVCASNVE